jgi:hypothetical protein
MAAAPAWGAEVSLSVHIGAAGERLAPGASAACHLTPSCFETQVRATDEQHLLRPAFETIAKRPGNRELSARENLQTESFTAGHEVAPSLVLQSSMPVSAVHSDDEHDVDKLHHVTVKRMVHPKKGNWLRFPQSVIEQIIKDKNKTGEPSQCWAAGQAGGQLTRKYHADLLTLPDNRRCVCESVAGWCDEQNLRGDLSGGSRFLLWRSGLRTTRNRGDVAAASRAPSRKAREGAHPQLFHFNDSKNPRSSSRVNRAHSSSPP